MKQKQLYILLPVALALWVLIVYKIVRVFSDREPIAIKSAVTKNTIEKEPENYTLSLDYSDPFLGNKTKVFQRTKQPVSSVVPKKKTQVQSKKGSQASFRNINYKGSYTNKSTGKKIAIVSLNANEYLIEQGESVEDYTILLINDDSVLMKNMEVEVWVKR